jgi:hypothetical protein
MRLFRYIPESDDYNCLDKSGNCSAFHQGKQIGASWTIPRINEDHHAGRIGDFPSLRGSVPVFSKMALAVLRPLIGHAIEALPLDCDSGRFYAINVLDIVNGLDLEKSDFIRFDDGRIMMINA